MSIIEKIKAEIERLYNDRAYSEDRWDLGYDCACEDIMSFLSDLEKSEKPMNQEGLDEEMDKFFETMPVLEHENIFEDTFKNIARHFYDLGCRRTAEKYDEIEYNRQREEELEKPINYDWLEEEIEKYREEHEFSIPAFQQVARHFAQWGAEHARE